MESRQFFLNQLPSVRILDLNPQTTIVVYDRNLTGNVPGFQVWLRKFPHQFPVRAGEKLKSISSFSKFATQVHRRLGEQVTVKWTVLAIGGGSVGDFAGFFASVYKRGLRLVHMPTTWLAAIDSSHGGKTALNLLGAKNQIGTFWVADRTIVAKPILFSLSQRQVLDAFGELIKIGLIDGGSWTKRLSLGGDNLRRNDLARISRRLWSALPYAVAAKLQVVNRDPKELKGHRLVLNLGHTFGHVIEALGRFSHGEAVWLGCQFAVDFSVDQGYLKSQDEVHLRHWLQRQSAPLKFVENRWRPLKKSAASKLLLQDKKRIASERRSAIDEIRFVFVQRMGKAIVKRVAVREVIEFALKNGWLK